MCSSLTSCSAMCSSLTSCSDAAPFSTSLLEEPVRICGPKREECLLVIWRPALTFGPQCLSGFGRNLFTFLAWALLRDATTRAKFACNGVKKTQTPKEKIINFHNTLNKQEQIEHNEGFPIRTHLQLWFLREDHSSWMIWWLCSNRMTLNL